MRNPLPRLAGAPRRSSPAAALAGKAGGMAGLAVFALMGGCAHLQVAEDGLGYAERQTRLRAVDRWRMNGRIAVDAGGRAFQGRFRWRQTAEEVELSISNPLGMSVLQVRGPLDRLTVRADGQTWELADPERELSALLGWWLPVRSLNAWLLGYPDRAFGAEEVLGPGRVALKTLEQRLWHLDYRSYRLAEGLLLPRRIDLAHGQLELRVIVDGWQPSS